MRARPLHLIIIALSLAGCRTPQPMPPVDDLIRQASKLDLDGEQDAAIALFQQALERAPDAYHAHYGLARALDLSGRYDEARTHFARAIELAPEYEKDQALRMMGVAWTFAGNVEEASRVFRQVFDRRMKDQNVGAAAETANELGRVYLEHGELDAAEERYRTGHDVAAREADLPAWRVDLIGMRRAHADARIAARRGRASEARRQAALFKGLLDKGGNDDQRVQYAYLVGYVDFSLGHYQDAVPNLEHADQKDPFILLLLAESHEKLGDAARARAYYQQVLGSTSHAVNNAFARPIARRKLAP